jgi:hypothetical protein
MKKLLFIFLLTVSMVSFGQQLTIGQLSEFMSDLTTAPRDWYKDYNPPFWRDYCKGYSNNYVSLRKGEEVIEIHYGKNFEPYLVEITCFNNYTLFRQLLIEGETWLPNNSHDYWECGMYAGKLVCTKQ